MSKLKPQLIVTGQSKKRGSYTSGVGYFIVLILVFILGVYVGMRVDSTDLHLDQDQKKNQNKKTSKVKTPSATENSINAEKVAAIAEKEPVSESDAQNSLSDITESDNNGSNEDSNMEEANRAGITGKDEISDGNVLADTEDLYDRGGNEISTLAPGTEEIQENGKDSYRLQVAAFADSAKAGEVVDQLKLKGYEAYIVTSTNSRGQTWNLIKIGNFSTAREAWNFSAEFLQKEGGEAFVESVNHGRVQNLSLEEEIPAQ